MVESAFLDKMQKTPHLLPWQHADWEKLRQYQSNKNIPQALLLTGSKGSAKSELAVLWAKTLLCDTVLPGMLSDNQTTACGHCASCELFQAGTHPDYMMIEPEEVGKAIKVGQIRQLVEFVSLTRSRGKIRVILVNPAESMNINAANSLLKTLEEPPENTLILLVSSKPAALSATIRSRCQFFPITAVDIESISAWLTQGSDKNADISEKELDLALALAEYSPFNAKFYLESSILSVADDLLNDWKMLANGAAKPSNIAEKWLKQTENIPIRLVYTWVIDMIRYHSINNNEVSNIAEGEVRLDFYHKDNQLIRELGLGIPLKRLFGMYDKVLEVLKLEHSSLNNQLQLESLLIQWSLIAQSK